MNEVYPEMHSRYGFTRRTTICASIEMAHYSRAAFPFLCSVVWCVLALSAMAQPFPPVGQWEPISQLEEINAYLGRNAAGAVIRVVLPQPTTTDEDLRPLSAFPQLESVDLRRTRVTDQGLLHLATLDNLKTLYLGPTITDHGLAILRSHKGIEHLLVRGAGITDIGAAHISEHRQLRSLALL